MKGHLYRVTVEQLADTKGNAVEKTPLSFEVKNHDDLFSVVAKLQEKQLFAEDEATAFAIGLKLFSEVMLTHKDHELFTALLPHFGEFMKTLKKA